MGKNQNDIVVFILFQKIFEELRNKFLKNKCLFDKYLAPVIAKQICKYDELKDFFLDKYNQKVVENLVLIISQQLTNEKSNNMFEILGYLKNLRQFSFYIRNTKIIKEKAIQLRKLFENFQNLQVLDLDFKKVADKSDSIKQISIGISQLKQLNRLNLDLSENFIGIRGLNILCENLSKLQKLQRLDLNLQSNGINGKIKLNQYLSSIKSLKKINIDISDNQISEIGAKNFAQILLFDLDRKELDLNLGQCGLGDQGLLYVAKNINQLKKLQFLKLQLQYNGIEGKFDVFQQLLGDLKYIEHLDIDFHGNGFSSEDMLQIFQGVKNLDQLQEFRLMIRSNDIQMFELDSNKDILKGYKNLQFLEIDIGFQSESFQKEIQQLLSSKYQNKIYIREF